MNKNISKCLFLIGLELFCLHTKSFAEKLRFLTNFVDFTGYFPQVISPFPRESFQSILIHSIFEIAHIDLLIEHFLTTVKQQTKRRYIFGLLESLEKEIILPVVLSNRRKFSHHTFSSSSNTMISAMRFGS